MYNSINTHKMNRANHSFEPSWILEQDKKERTSGLLSADIYIPVFGVISANATIKRNSSASTMTCVKTIFLSLASTYHFFIISFNL
jgi:hypothetical protein